MADVGEPGSNPDFVKPFLKGSLGRNTRGFLRVVILTLIAAAAVSSRLFSVIRMSTGADMLLDN